MVTGLISKLESAHAKVITPSSAAQEEWVDMVDKLTEHTLYPFTNSWWNASNVPGKKVQQLTYILGLNQYQVQCKAILDELKGFEVVYEDGKKVIDEEMPVKAATAS